MLHRCHSDVRDWTKPFRFVYETQKVHVVIRICNQGAAASTSTKAGGAVGDNTKTDIISTAANKVSVGSDGLAAHFKSGGSAPAVATGANVVFMFQRGWKFKTSHFCAVCFKKQDSIRALMEYHMVHYLLLYNCASLVLCLQVKPANVTGLLKKKGIVCFIVYGGNLPHIFPIEPFHGASLKLRQKKVMMTQRNPRRMHPFIPKISWKSYLLGVQS